MSALASIVAYERVPIVQTITPTQHEKSEWARMAVDAYKHDHNFYGHRYSAWSASIRKGESIRLDIFDTLQNVYRSWLIGGWPEVYKPR